MRSLALRKDSGYLPIWETKRGTLHTASELLRLNNNLEMQAAIWIAGSVWDKIHALPDTWRGETYRMLDNIYLAIRRQFANIDVWHHAARYALPFSITERYRDEELHVGQKIDDLLYLCVIEAAIINGNWKLIRFVPAIQGASSL